MEEGYSFVGLGHRHRSRSIQPVFLEGVELRWKHLSSEQVGIRSTIAISLESVASFCQSAGPGASARCRA
jgi:hypothetical protein